MIDNKLICRALNLEYFDFLDGQFFNSGFGTIHPRQALEFYATDNENYLKSNNTISLFNNVQYEEAPKYNIGENFYIGHFYFESLKHISNGQSKLFDMFNASGLKRLELKKHFFDQWKHHKEHPKFNDDDYGLSNGKLVRKENYYKDKYDNFKHNEDPYPTYKQFIDYYDESKEKDISGKEKDLHFHRTYKPNKESYLEYVYTNIKTSQAFFKKKLEAFIPNTERYKHTYITGSSGSGKSEMMKSLIFSVLRTQKEEWFSSNHSYIDKFENFILIEPHGDLSNDVLKLSSKFECGASKTLVLDPFLYADKTPIINPLEFQGNETELNSYSEELLNVFKEVLGTDFTLNAEALLTPCIATLLKLDNTSLYDLQAFMNDEENYNLVERGKITKNFAHKNFFETGFYSPNLNSTKRAIYLKLQTLLNNKTFSNLTTGKSTFDLEDIMNKRKNLIVKLNKKKMRETLSPFGRFLIARIQSVALKRADTPENLRPKTHLFIDEFQNFISPSIEEILTESRKYKLFLTMAHQVISQIEENKLKDIILSNTNIKIVGLNGQQTLSKLSKEIKVEMQELESLKVGEFYIRVGRNDAIKVYNQLLKKDLYSSKLSITKLAQNSSYEYYVKPTAQKVNLKTDRKKDLVNTIIKDKSDRNNEEDIAVVEPIKKPKFDNF